MFIKPAVPGSAVGIGPPEWDKGPSHRMREPRRAPADGAGRKTRNAGTYGARRRAVSQTSNTSPTTGERTDPPDIPSLAASSMAGE